MIKISLLTIIFYLIFKAVISSSTNIELSSLSADQGFSITGEVSGDYFGYAVAGAGDINGDGTADFIVSAVRAATTSTKTPGAVYVIFGNKNGFSNISLSSGFSATQAFKITGTANADYFGWSAAAAGDFNKDGISDLAIGASYADYTISGGSTLSSAGTGYVIFGRTTWASTINISAISPPINGFEVQGSQTNGLVGYSLGKAGDVNGDGITDFMIGAPGESYGGTNSGTVYVVYGLSTGITNIDFYASSSLTSSKGFKIQGYNNLYLGRQVSYIGDFNGDDVDDILMGGHVQDGSSPGNAYVVFGKNGGISDIDVASGLASTNGITIKGMNIGDALGFSVSAAGDFNGDGLADIILGAPFADPEGRNNAGVAFVIFGSTASSSVIDLSQGLDSSTGIKIIGAAQDNSLGYTVSNAGDINGDGVDDVMMGAFASTISTKEGAVYVVYGRKTGIADVDLANNNLDEGFKIINAGDHNIGFSIGYAGDVNGDGNDDIIIGSMKTSALGSAFVIYGTSTPSISQGDTLDTIAKVQGAAIQVAQVVALGLTLLNYSNAGPMFFVALAKLLHYMKYLTIKYPEKLQYLLDRPNSKLISIPSISSAPETVKDAVTKYSLPENFEKYDIPSSFLVNQWSFIMTILIIIAAIFVVELGVLVTNKWEFLHSKISKLKESVKWNYIISVFIGNFGGIAFNTALEMRRVEPNSDVDSLSFSVCLIMNIAVVLLCIRILWILLRFFQEKRRSVQTRISRKFERFKAEFKGYKVIFDGFQSHSFLLVTYLLLFSLRLYFFNVIVAYLFESPLAQTILINIQGLLFIFYLGFKKPIKEKIEFIGFLLQELILQAIHICVLTLAVMDTMDIDENSDLSVLFGNVIIGCNVLFVIVGLFYIFICVVRDICKISKSGDTLAEKDVTVRARNRNSSESQITLNIDQNLSTDQRSVDNSLVYNSNAEIEQTTKQNDSFHESTRRIPQGHVEYLTNTGQRMKEKSRNSPSREQGALHLQLDHIKRSGRDRVGNRMSQSPHKDNSNVNAGSEHNNNVNNKKSFWEKRKSNKNKKRIENY